MELLKKLTMIYAPSGNEKELTEIINKEVSPFADKVFADSLGNLIAHKKGSGKKLMLSAHIDQIGVMVTFIEDRGFLRIQNVGDIKPAFLVGKRIRFKNSVLGVVYYEQCADISKLEFENLYVDIGASTKEKAEKLVGIGDVAVFDTTFTDLGDVIVSNALDNRVGAYALIEILKKTRKTNFDLYFVFTVQKEIGFRGAGPAAFGIDPDMAITVDVTATGDTPSAKPMAVKLGGGVAIKAYDKKAITNSDIKMLLLNTAKQFNIPYQMEVLIEGGSETGVISQIKSGIKAGGISIPARYIHSPSEMVSKHDIYAAIKLLLKIIEKPF